MNNKSWSPIPRSYKVSILVSRSPSLEQGSCLRLPFGIAIMKNSPSLGQDLDVTSLKVIKYTLAKFVIKIKEAFY